MKTTILHSKHTWHARSTTVTDAVVFHKFAATKSQCKRAAGVKLIFQN